VSRPRRQSEATRASALVAVERMTALPG